MVESEDLYVKWVYDLPEKMGWSTTKHILVEIIDFTDILKMFI